MNNDLISRSDAIEVLTGWDTEPTDFDIEYELSCLPTVDAEPVRHGVWNENITFNKREYPAFPVKRGYICSLCGRKERKKEPYCHCGAKMDAEVEG